MRRIRMRAFLQQQQIDTFNHSQRWAPRSLTSVHTDSSSRKKKKKLKKKKRATNQYNNELNSIFITIRYSPYKLLRLRPKVYIFCVRSSHSAYVCVFRSLSASLSIPSLARYTMHRAFKVSWHERRKAFFFFLFRFWRLWRLFFLTSFCF